MDVKNNQNTSDFMSTNVQMSNEYHVFTKTILQCLGFNFFIMQSSEKAGRSCLNLVITKKASSSVIQVNQMVL